MYQDLNPIRQPPSHEKCYHVLHGENYSFYTKSILFLDLVHCKYNLDAKTKTNIYLQEHVPRRRRAVRHVGAQKHRGGDLVGELLRGERDEQKLAGLLVAANVCRAGDADAVRKVYDAVGPRFLRRLLNTGK